MILRVTRITKRHATTNLIFLHPYPIWMKNTQVKVQSGSLLVPVTELDMKNGRIEQVALLRFSTYRKIFDYLESTT